MKTSNKLLTLLLVLLFAIPPVMIAGFETAIKNNHYLVKSPAGFNVEPLNEMKPFKVVKLEGNRVDRRFGLVCHIYPGDKYGYRFTNYDPGHAENGRTDSCHTELLGDTLIVRYHTRSSEIFRPNNYHYGVQIEITVPKTVSVWANNSVVNIDSSISPLDALNLALTNNALVNIGYNKDARDIGEPDMPTAVFPKIIIEAANSEIILNRNSIVKNLQAHLHGNSTLEFADKAAVDTLSGTISDQSVLNAPYRYVKKLSAQ